MSIAKSYSAHLAGLNVEVITVEVDISNGLNAVSIVGLGDRAVEESKDRVSAAVKNSGYTSPKQKNQKVVISLAPADVRKEGPSFDLAISVAYLKAAGDISADTEHTLFLGELSLEGDVRRVSGVLPIICQAAQHGFDRVCIPEENSQEASLATGIRIYPLSSLRQLLGFISGTITIKPLTPIDLTSDDSPQGDALFPDRWDMSMIRGNEAAKRGLEIAAAGMHNVCMFGPPGTGKTMLAQSFQTILPRLTHEEAVEVTSIHSAARSLGNTIVRTPPFRSPHHTASHTAIVGGGGAVPKPGEITLAHRGVLFMDEFPEFDRSVIEALRQPLEERTITISRAKGSTTFPAHCILVASMNPCPCGKRQVGGCTCQQSELRAYDRKMSGPIVDRIDIWLNVHKVDYEKLAKRTHICESSADMRRRVMAARQKQLARFARIGSTKRYNSEMDADDMSRLAIMSSVARTTLRDMAKLHGMSARAFHRVIKVAQTLVDLGSDTFIKKAHILEALRYREQAGEFTDRAQHPQKDSEHHGPPSAHEGRS